MFTPNYNRSMIADGIPVTGPNPFLLKGHDCSFPNHPRKLSEPSVGGNAAFFKAVAPSGAASIPSIAARRVTVSQLSRLMEKRSATILKIYAYGDLRDQGRERF